jgi:hypothetical protein
MRVIQLKGKDLAPFRGRERGNSTMILSPSVSNESLAPISLPFSNCLRALVRASIASVIVVSFCASLCRAQATYTAASSNESDVQSAVTKMSSAGGGTVNVPCNPTTPVWTTTLTSSNSFTLNFEGATPNTGAATIGSGTNCVTIQDNNPSGPIIQFTPTYQSGQIVVIQNVNIDPVSPTTTLVAPIDIEGSCTASGCPNFRINNITFGKSTQWTEAGNGSQAAAVIRVNDVFGVMDHNTAPSGSNVELFNAQMYSYLGVGANGDNSWAQPDSLGGAANVFAENNLWNTGYLSLNDCEATNIGGCRVVDRYNVMVASQTSAFGIFENHGTETAGRGRSGREAEVYGNTITCLGACAGVDGGLRGGTGMFFYNHGILTPGQGANTWLGISLYRNVASFPPWGACGGSGPYDQNDGVTYFSGTMSTSGNGVLTMTDNSNTFGNLIPTGYPYSVYDVTQGFWSEVGSNTSHTITIMGPISEDAWAGFNNGDTYQVLRAQFCIDQPGRGQGNYISGTTPSTTGWVSEALDPIYQWGDFFTGGANVNSPIGVNSGKLLANRDYFPQAAGVQISPTSPFNGTSGTGWGTLANRPTTCTPAVGYFATDQGNWNQSGSGGQGELFVCTATNTWTLHYEPYAYPHPLTSGTVTSGNLPQPPTNLTASVN